MKYNLVLKIFLYVSFFLINLSVLATEVAKINLTQDCNKVNVCKQHQWIMIDSFSENYFSISEMPTSKDWKPIEKFPIFKMSNYFIAQKDVQEYSFLTFFDVPDELLNNSVFNGVRFSAIGEVFDIYINGSLIAREGEIENGKIIVQRSVRGQIWQLNKGILKPSNNQLLIKITADPYNPWSGLYMVNGYEIGLYDDLKQEEQDRTTLVFIGIYMAVGAYHLFLFLRRRAERYNFYFGSFIFILGIYLYTRSSTIFEHKISTVYITKLELISLYICALFHYCTLEQLFFDKIRKFLRYFVAYHIILALLTLLLPSLNIILQLLTVWQLSTLTLGFGYVGYTYNKAIKEKRPNAKRLLFATLLFLCSTTFDILDSMVFATGLAFSKYVLFGYVFGFATILANNFIEIHKKTEELNESLERRVEERTRALSDSLEHIRELKVQQDGDYFLTSLLLKPLSLNNAVMENVIIEFLLKQKKQFTFRKWVSEIGGDLCRSETILLKGRKMTAFLNSDAMGKSIQGAGGALVFGSVFNSIIERTNMNSAMQENYPERWLKNAFIELHKVFETFDGSMLVSLVIGLIDNRSGLLYFLNAEHPFPVLYRDGVASFLGEERIYRKLGSQVTADFISIQAFQLRMNDFVIVGSDGKDDLLLTESSGKKALNYNEELFLRTVEESKGNLNSIYQAITSKAELTDDLSLMSIRLQNSEIPDEVMDDVMYRNGRTIYKSKEEINEAMLKYQKNPIQNLGILKDLIYSSADIKEYSFACSFAEEYLGYMPSDTELIFFFSCLERTKKNYIKSIDLGERVRLREPNHIPNLIHLGETYFEYGNIERCKAMYKKVKSIDPTYEIMHEIIQSELKEF